MANNRATKSRFAAEAHRKISSKYSEELAQECLEWINAIIGEPTNTSGDMDNFYEVLKDGTIFCKLVNDIQPNMVKKVNVSKMAFKCMDNINAFLEAAKALGVPAQETFLTFPLLLSAFSLLDQRNQRKICKTSQKNSLGPVGQGVISLQNGSNK